MGPTVLTGRVARPARSLAAAWLGAALLAGVAAACGGSGPARGQATGSAEVVAGDPAGGTGTSAGAPGSAGGAGTASGASSADPSGGGGLAATVAEPGPIELSGRPVKVTGTNTGPGEVDRYTFTGTARERVSIEIVAMNGTCQSEDGWQLDLDVLGPDGVPLRHGKGYAGIAGCSGYGPWTLPTDGTYTATFTSGNGGAGSYAAIVARLADTAAPIDLQQPATVSGTIDIALDSRRYTFTGKAGDRLSAEVVTLNGGCLSEDLWNVTIDVVGSDGQTARRSSPGYAGIAGCSGFGPWTLPADGAYTATLTSDGRGKGAFQVVFARLARTATPVDLGAPATVTGTIDVALDSRRYTFSGTKGQQVSAQVTAFNGSCESAEVWSLELDVVGADGQKVGTTAYPGIAGCSTFGPWKLPANGEYAVTFTGRERGKGSFTAVLSRTS